MWLLIAIIGAVVCGIIMAVANANAKRGVAWGMPVTIISGIAAIGFSVWALMLQLFGPENPVNDAWEEVRGTGIASVIKETYKDKKILVLRNHVGENAPTDIAFEAFEKGLEGLNFEILELPEVQVSENEPPMDMGPTGLNVKLDKKALAKFEVEKGILEALLQGKNFDLVVVWGSLNERMAFKGKNTKPSKMLEDKLFVYPNGRPSFYNRRGQEMPPPANVLGWFENNSLEEADWDKSPTGVQEVDFLFRYTWKVNTNLKK